MTSGWRGPPLDTLLRRAALGLVASTAWLLPPTIDDPYLRDTVPWFALVLVLQLAPVLWPRKVDLGAPTVLVGTGGIIPAAAVAAALASFLQSGHLDIVMVGDLDAAETAALARLTLQTMALASVSFYVGYYHPRLGQRWRRVFPRVAGLEWSGRRLRAIAAIAFAAFAASYIFFQSRVGVSIFDPTQLGTGKQVWRDDPTLSWMFRGVQLGFVPGYLFLAMGLKGRRKIASLGAILAMSALAYLVLRIGQRGIALFPLLGLILIFHYLRRRVSVALFALLLVGTIAANNVFFSWRVGPLRTATWGEDDSGIVARVQTELAVHERERQRFSAFAFLLDQFPKNHPYLLGQSWLGLLVAPIPRWIWPDKGDYFRWRDTAIIYSLVKSSTPTPFPALLYVNFSWLGVVVGLMLWGAFQRGLYQWLEDNPGDPNVVVLYTMFLLFFVPTVAGMSAALQYVLPIWLAIRFVGRRPPGVTADSGGAALPARA